MPKCVKCNLSLYSHINCFQGNGSKKAKIMVIGEAPDMDTERTHRNYSGKAGKMLLDLFKEAGIKAEDVWYCNAVRCRAVDAKRSAKKVPIKPEHLIACSSYLEAEIAEIKPNVIIAAGNISLKSVVEGKVEGITRERGKVLYSEKYKCKIIPIVNPAMLLRDAKLYSSTVEDLKKALAESSSPDLTPKRKVHYPLVDTVSSLDDLLNALTHPKLNKFAYDIETTGKDWMKDDIICLGFSWVEATGVSLRFLNEDGTHFWSDETWKGKILPALQTTFRRPDTLKIAQNELFEHHFMRQAQIEISGPKADTMLMHHLLVSEAEHGLKKLAWQYTDMGGYEDGIHIYLDHLKKEERNYLKIPWKVLGRYNSADCDCTLRCYNVFEKLLAENGLTNLFQNLTMPLSSALFEAEHTGVYIDFDLTKKLTNEFLAESLVIKKEFEKTVGTELNLGSYPQLCKALFDVLKLDSQVLKDNDLWGKTGPSLNAKGLKLLSAQNVAVEPIVKYRHLTKMTSTYLQGARDFVFTRRSPGPNPLEIEEAFKNDVPSNFNFWNADDVKTLGVNEPYYTAKINNRLTEEYNKKKGKRKKKLKLWKPQDLERLKYMDGKIHCNFHIHGTRTGRLSVRRPGLQTIPKLSVIRNIFKASPGFKLIDADFKQAEVRALAAYSRDAKLIHDFNSGVEIHRMVASRLLNIPPDQVTDSQRNAAKSVIFGIMYGRQAESISVQYGIPVEEAQDFIDKFFSMYVGAKYWIDSTIAYAQAHGKSVSMFGRIRHLPDIKGSNYGAQMKACRQAMNFPIQSAASDATLLSIIRVTNRFNSLKMQSRFILTVHDSAMYEVLEAELDVAVPIIREEMTVRVMSPHVPIEIDLDISNCWKEGKTVAIEAEKDQEAFEEDEDFI